MHSAIAWNYVRLVVVLSMVSFGLWMALGTADGQEESAESLYLPNVVNGSAGTIPLPTSTPETPAPPDDTFSTPIAAWNFQEGAGLLAADISGNGLDGRLDSPAWTNDGNESGALRFDGVDDSVRVQGLQLRGGALTLLALIKADRLDHLSEHDARIISKASGGVDEQDHFWMLSTIRSGNETRLRFRLKIDGVTQTLISNAEGSIVPDAWTHVAATFDGATMRLYKNGVEVGAMSYSGSISDDDTVEAWIGDQPSSPGTRPWHGAIDDVQLFDTVLSPDQIQSRIPVNLIEASLPWQTATPTPTSSPGEGDDDGNETPTPLPPDSGDDTTPPAISNVTVAILGQSAVVSWKTDEPATTRVDFGTTTDYALGPVDHTQLVTSHSVWLTGLTAATTYHYRVQSTDASSNVATGTDALFTTSDSGTAPTIDFLDTFDGSPPSPQPFISDQWDVTVHSRGMDNLYGLKAMDAHHGPNCEPPMATHRISAYEDAVYKCKDHVMTAINDSGYGLIYLTPAYQVDFTDGPATIRFDVSTFRSSFRDWIDLYVSPMEDHLQLALRKGLPDLSGEPKRALKVKMIQAGDDTAFTTFVIDNHNRRELESKWWVGYEEFMEPSASVRSTFELQISRTHIKFGMPEYDFWWVDEEISPLDWTVGVVQLGHHSYNPEKDCPGCTANTWHWDDVNIDPAKPFTMIHSTSRYADATNGGTMSFAAPAPDNAFLRFAGLGHDIKVSFDGGQTWEAAQVQQQVEYTVGKFWSYFMPIPAGVQDVQFRGDDWWGGPWHVRDASIWAE